MHVLLLLVVSVPQCPLLIKFCSSAVVVFVVFYFSPMNITFFYEVIITKKFQYRIHGRLKSFFSY